MFKLKLIDRYIIRKFLGTFVFALMIIIMIVIVFDISEKIDDFLGKKAPLKAIIFDYYLNFIPYFINLFSPLFTFISVIFFTAKMASNTEIVAILSGGVSFRRMMAPFMAAAAMIAVFSYVLSGWIIPPANKTRLEFENTYIRNPYQNTAKNIHRQIVPGEFVYMESYNAIDQVGYKFSLEKIKDGELEYKLFSDFIRWDSTEHKWQVNNYFIRKVNGLEEKLYTGVRFDTTFAFAPIDFSRRLNNIETMNNAELDRFIELEKLRGSEAITHYLIEKYRRTSVPFATFILTIIAVALASRKVRGGIGLQIGLGITLSFTYIMFMQITTTFSTNGGLSPLLAVWTPNLIFLGISLFLLRNAPK